MIKVLDFSADWCSPCKFMEPIFEELIGEYSGKVEFESIDVESNRSIASKYQVMSIPTFVVLKEGRETSRRIGAMPKESLKSWIDDNL